MNEQFINDLSKELAKLGTIHSVGEEWFSYTGKIPSGGIPYCGQEITRETYSALWSWVQAQGLVKTESEWQSIASSQNGNVPFYSSGNGTTTFRMPKLVGYVKGASSQSEAGTHLFEGLPNITGSVGLAHLTANGGEGALRYDNGSNAANYGTTASSNAVSVRFDASRSNPIYGNSDHVTPETSVVLFGVYAFGVVTNADELDVATIARDASDAKTGLATIESKLVGVVRSVNGTSADASGNVTIAVSKGTVSQKYSGTLKGTKSSPKTQTITGLTANKPLIIQAFNNSAYGIGRIYIGSGIAKTSTNSRKFESKELRTFSVIPTGTSISITVTSDDTSTTDISVNVYQ